MARRAVLARPGLSNIHSFPNETHNDILSPLCFGWQRDNEQMKAVILFFLTALAVLQAQTFPVPNRTHPAVIYKVAPEYTPEAKAAKRQGLVTLSVTVLADGTPSDIKVLRGLGLGLDEKAVECLQQWHFRPATRDGEPVAIRAQVEINFRLP
jgi:TonB family protein